LEANAAKEHHEEYPCDEKMFHIVEQKFVPDPGFDSATGKKILPVR
jgi:hypothetical protein